MSRIFITGGTGYVGGRIAQALLADGGFEVCVATRSLVDSLPYLPGAQVVQVDFDDVADLTQKMAGATCVFHLAAANEIICGQDVQQAIHSNILHGVNCLEAAKKAGVTRFINFSTAHVYGPLHGQIDETCLPAPRHPYAVSHLGFEGFVSAAMLSSHIEGINMRLSNSFGAPVRADVDRWSLLANDLCHQVATKNQIVLNSDGTQTRDFIPLSDVANISVGLARLPREKLGNGVFNLGGNRTASILEMANMVAASARKLMGKEIEITRPTATRVNAPPFPLTFSTQKLTQAGLTSTVSFEDEMDCLLEACLRFFATN